MSDHSRLYLPSDAMEDIAEAIDFLDRVIAIDRSAAGRGYSESLVKGHRTMMTNTNRDVLCVEEAAHIVRMHPFDDEAYDPILLGDVRTEMAYPRKLGDPG